jgi:hypothetical protein
MANRMRGNIVYYDRREIITKFVIPKNKTAQSYKGMKVTRLGEQPLRPHHAVWNSNLRGFLRLELEGKGHQEETGETKWRKYMK